jgi:hypothetical protein
MSSEIVYDAVAHMQEIDARVPITAKLDGSLREIKGYFKSHHARMSRQTHNGLREIITILTASLEAETADARRRCTDDAAKGALGPRRVLRSVE